MTTISRTGSQAEPKPLRRAPNRAWRAFWRNPLTTAGTVGAVALIVLAIFAHAIAPYNYAEQHLVDRSRPPSQRYLLGTDQFGRDLLSRIIYGARISLIVGVASTLVGSALGVALGTVAGYAGGWTDEVIMRVMDVIMAFPSIVLGIALAAVLGPGLGNLILIIGLLQIPHFARITRGSVLSAKELDYVLAAHTLGQRSLPIVGRHVLPNCIGPIVVLASLTVSTAIGAEAALSFLGLGIQPPTPTWGNMLADGRQFILQAPWIATFAGLAITITILAFNFIGDGLRDAIDPRS